MDLSFEAISAFETNSVGTIFRLVGYLAPGESAGGDCLLTRGPLSRMKRDLPLASADEGATWTTVGVSFGRILYR